MLKAMDEMRLEIESSGCCQSCKDECKEEVDSLQNLVGKDVTAHDLCRLSFSLNTHLSVLVGLKEDESHAIEIHSILVKMLDELWARYRKR
jgi:hypothetical protein